MMNKKKGMTLIEIIIALAILGIISVTFLPSSVKSFSNMINSRELTTNTFAAQEDLEDKIENERKLINSTGYIPSETLNLSFDNGKTASINGTTLKGESNGVIITAFLPDIKEPVDTTFPNVSVKTIPKNVDEEVINENLSSINIWNKSNVSFEGDITYHKNPGDDEYENRVFRLIHTWHISKDEYVEGDILSFPDDYELIKSTTKENPTLAYKDQLDIKEEYANKLIIYSITQVSIYGRYGEIYSNPILVEDYMPVEEVDVYRRNGSHVNYTGYNSNDPFVVKQNDYLKGYIKVPEDVDYSGVTVYHRWYVSNNTTIGEINNITIQSDFTQIPDYDDTSPNLRNISYKDKYIVYSFEIEGQVFFSIPVKISYVELDISNLNITINYNSSNDRLNATISNPDNIDYEPSSGKWYVSQVTYNGIYIYEKIVDPYSGNVTQLRNVNSNHGGRVIKYGITIESNIIYSNEIYMKPNNIYIIDDLNKEYKFIARNTSQVADIAGGTDNIGSEMIVYAPHGGSNQKFKFEPTDDGYYRISVQYSTGKKRYIQRESTSSNKVIQAEYSDTNLQKWYIEISGSYYRFRNVSYTYGRYLYVNGNRSSGSYPIEPLTLENSTDQRTHWTIQAY